MCMMSCISHRYNLKKAEAEKKAIEKKSSSEIDKSKK